MCCRPTPELDTHFAHETILQHFTRQERWTKRNDPNGLYIYYSITVIVLVTTQSP